MKPFKSLGSLALGATALLLVTSCTKNVDEQFAKGGNEVGKFIGGPPACQPFVGIQVKKDNPSKTFVFYGNNVTPTATQAFWGSDFSANTLLSITATGGTPFHRNDWNYIGVTDGWITAGEVLSIKLSGSLTGKAANRMNMQLRKALLTGKADFYLNGVHVGDTALSGGPATQSQELLVYTAEGNKSDFDEVRFSVTSGYLAITAYTPEHTKTPIPAGQSGFYLVEAPGRAVVARFHPGTTVIAGDARPNQYFTFESSYGNPAIDVERQNREGGFSGEFPVAMWAGARHWVNIWGSTGVTPTPLAYGTDLQGRLGVGDRFISGSEMVTITPGADFPDGGSSAKMRAVQVSTATLPDHMSVMLVEVWSGATLVGSGKSSGEDNSVVSVIPGKEFNRVTIKAFSGTDLSIGRNVHGPIAATIKLYPACP